MACLLSLNTLLLHALDVNTSQLNVDRSGQTLCTLQLQSAIDRISASGGGRLTLGPGIYLTGTLVMKSGVAVLPAEAHVPPSLVT